ncbi:MAG: 4Fe-4S dicluster domain-containing protein [Negativicutes bacterium]|nr:4Fe-4S dicluster domain-containing protein [Negativicutes bacterium]
MNVDCKLKLLEFLPDGEFQHVRILDAELCRKCDAVLCLTLCPSAVFRWNYQHETEPPVLVYYRQCIECGACRLICPKNNIEFCYPNGGFGVTFKDGISVYLRPYTPPEMP